MVGDVTLMGAANNAQRTEMQGAQLAEDFNQFLVLLTTQLQNQDPLNPMDSTEFTNQLVQFSQVEQAINTNQKLDDLVSLQIGSAAGMALGYVGLDINYMSGEAYYDGDTPIEISYALEKEARQVTMNIYDEANNLIYTTAAPTAPGTQRVTWNGDHLGGGKVESGTYKIVIDAFDSEGQNIEKATAVSGNVSGIESQNGMVFLLVGERAVPLGQVINAKLPGSPSVDIEIDPDLNPDPDPDGDA